MKPVALCLAGLALGSCVTSPTHKHLFDRGDPLRYQMEMTVPETWTSISFDDTPWAMSTGRSTTS
jgi:hypothetical protein